MGNVIGVVVTGEEVMFGSAREIDKTDEEMA